MLSAFEYKIYVSIFFFLLKFTRRMNGVYVIVISIVIFSLFFYDVKLDFVNRDEMTEIMSIEYRDVVRLREHKK